MANPQSTYSTSYGSINKLDVDVEEHIDGYDGLRLLYRRYSPTPSSPRVASVVLIHGFGEHGGRFSHVAAALVSQGCVVHTIDLRGHGYSGGPRADGKIAWMLEDIRIVHRRANENLPLFFYGHSMGGMLVIRYLQTYPNLPVAGAIITSPLLRLHSRIPLPSWKKWALGAAAPVFGEFLIGSNVDPCSLSSDAQEIDKVFNDRLALPFMTVRFAHEMLVAADAALAGAPEFAYPVILVHGENDTITDPGASAEFAAMVERAHAQAHIIPGGKHELHNDVQFQQLQDLVFAWVADRLANPRPDPGTAKASASRSRSRGRVSLPNPTSLGASQAHMIAALYIVRALNTPLVGSFRIRHAVKWALTCAWPLFFWIFLPCNVFCLLFCLLVWQPSRVPWTNADTLATLWLGPLFLTSLLVREHRTQ